MLKTQVLIVGGGITGLGLARDLALRGVQCMVVEKGHLSAGASGSNHGLLHSGARYVSNDPATAAECRAESHLLKKLAPACCEDTGGLFVAVEGDSENYIADFPGYCERSGISALPVDCGEARELEPELADNLIAAYRVEDATVDPFRLLFDTLADARAHGAVVSTWTRVEGMERRGGRVCSVRVRQVRTGEEYEIEADQVVNAAGAWSGIVAGIAGLDLKAVWSKGSVLITQQRIADCVINRLRPPSDGDIVVPGGTVSLLGTSSVRVDNLENVRTDHAEVDFLVQKASEVLPVVRDSRLIRAFAGVRPLISRGNAGDDRSVSRASEVIDHDRDGLSNFITVVGGKLTTFRLTAEMAADLLCARLGVNAACSTANVPLPSAPVNEWVVAGVAPGLWMRGNIPGDALLCECEMVPVSGFARIVEQIRAEGETVDLDSIRLRSRMGKGSCQGAFCSLRITEYLYEQGIYEKRQGIDNLRKFLESRWKGLRPVLWGRQMVQEQLQEAVHCGIFGLETLE